MSCTTEKNRAVVNSLGLSKESFPNHIIGNIQCQETLNFLKSIETIIQDFFPKFVFLTKSVLKSGAIFLIYWNTTHNQSIPAQKRLRKIHKRFFQKFLKKNRQKRSKIG